MGLLGVISGTIGLRKSHLLEGCRAVKVQNEYGETTALVTDKVVLIPRHGHDSRDHILPHAINHRANLKALKDFSVSEVVGINSTGSLKTYLHPGMIVIPDDFIMLTATPTIYQNKAVHIIPSLNEKIRQKLICAASNLEMQVVEKGVYWQMPGPRLETKAEILLMANYADIVGMTMVSEAVVALELDLPYAAACSIDNYGNGLEKKPLTVHEIAANVRKNADNMIRLLKGYQEIIS